MTAQPMIRVTDETTCDELAEALANINTHAKRQQHIVEKFTEDVPTAWTRAHRQINALLDDMDRARA